MSTDIARLIAPAAAPRLLTLILLGGVAALVALRAVSTPTGKRIAAFFDLVPVDDVLPFSCTLD